MYEAQPKFGKQLEKRWGQFQRIVSVAKRRNLQINPRALLSKQQQKCFLRLKGSHNISEYIFDKIISRCVLTAFEWIGRPVALRMDTRELPSVRSRTLLANLRRVLCLQLKAAGNDLGINARMPDPQCHREGVTLHEWEA